jgi:hypothetical protein
MYNIIHGNITRIKGSPISINIFKLSKRSKGKGEMAGQKKRYSQLSRVSPREASPHIRGSHAIPILSTSTSLYLEMPSIWLETHSKLIWPSDSRDHPSVTS